MTDATTETDNENVDWSDVENDAKTTVTYPENGPLPEARFSLNFTPGRPPQLTVRAHTGTDLVAALNELEEGGVYGAIGVAHASLTAQASIGAGLGPTTPMPQAPAGAPTPPAPQGATPPPFGPNVSVPQAPGYQGPPAPPPAPQAPAGGQAPRNGPKPRPGWPSVFRIEVPFPQKDAFKAYREEHKEYFKGKVLWAGGGGYWVHGDVVQSFGPYNPVPA